MLMSLLVPMMSEIVSCQPPGTAGSQRGFSNLQRLETAFQLGSNHHAQICLQVDDCLHYAGRCIYNNRRPKWEDTSHIGESLQEQKLCYLDKPACSSRLCFVRAVRCSCLLLCLPVVHVL